MELAYCNKTINKIYYKGCPVNTVYYKGTKVFEKPSGYVRLVYNTSAEVYYNNGCCLTESYAYCAQRARVRYKADTCISVTNCTNIDCLCVVLIINKKDLPHAMSCSVCMGGINNVGGASIKIPNTVTKDICLSYIGHSGCCLAAPWACAYYDSSNTLRCYVCCDTSANALFGAGSEHSYLSQFRTGLDSDSSVFCTCLDANTTFHVRVYIKCNSDTFNCLIAEENFTYCLPSSCCCKSCCVCNSNKQANGCVAFGSFGVFTKCICISD